MTCDFLVKKVCTHPENAYFLNPIIASTEVLASDGEVCVNKAKVIYMCKGQDQCKVYQSLMDLKKQGSKKSVKIP